MRNRWFFFTAIILLCVVSPLTAASAAHLAKAEALSDLIPGYGPFLGAGISPDGSMIAWGADDGLCLYTISSASVHCAPWPEGFEALPYLPSSGSVALPWSPDSRQLTFTENFFQYFNESDIWVYDVAQDKFTDLTDDGLTGSGSFLRPSHGTPPPAVDTLSTWNPATGNLMFFRNIRHNPQDSHSITLELYSIPAAGGNPAQIADLTNRFAVPYPTITPPVLSPDGSLMALIAQYPPYDDLGNGVWIFNLADNSLTQVVSLDDIDKSLPTFTDGKAYPQSVSWANGGLVISTGSPHQSAPEAWSNTFFYDTASKQLTGMVDFSTLSDEAALTQVGSSGHSPLYDLPRAGVVSPDSKSYIYLHSDQGATTAAVSMVPLPLDGSAPIDLGEIPSFSSAQPTFATISDDGTRAVMLGYLLTFES